MTNKYIAYKCSCGTRSITSGNLSRYSIECLGCPTCESKMRIITFGKDYLETRRLIGRKSKRVKNETNKTSYSN